MYDSLNVSRQMKQREEKRQCVSAGTCPEDSSVAGLISGPYLCDSGESNQWSIPV